MAAGTPTAGQAAYGPRPSLLLEQRAGLELAHLLSAPVYYGAGVPQGDGAPVLLIPGFLGSDSYLTVMHGWMRRMGYRPHGSGIAINIGRPLDLVARMVARAESVAGRTSRPVTVIGHSLGGVLGGIVARLRPDIVAHVITLGSPMCGEPRRATHPLVVALGEMLLSGGVYRPGERALEQQLYEIPLPRSVRLTCIYSRQDAVVRWQDCIHADPRTTALEVTGTHTGLAWNAQVYRHLARMLPA